MNNQEIIKVEDLTRNYRMIYAENPEDREIKVLKGLNFAVKTEEFVGIMGKSGCGKTTLLKVLGLIDKPTDGTLYFNGVDSRKLWSDELADIRRRKMGFVFQDFYLLDSLSVEDNIMVPMVLDKAPVKDCLEKVAYYMEKFGLMHLTKKKPNELSGGERQRVAICRALINDPELILADEPTGNLDSRTSSDVLGLLKVTSQKFHQTLVMITHNNEIAQLADRIIRIEDGKIAQ